MTFGLLLTLAPVGGASAVQIGGPFELVDQHGATRTDADFRGSYLLIYFGYTYCPDLCPTTLLKMTGAIEELATRSPSKADHVIPIFVSFDPDRDTPELLRDYAESFHTRLVALTGSPRALAKSAAPTASATRGTRRRSQRLPHGPYQLRLPDGARR